ncbi:MAG: radical SAM protein [Bacteroidia bacterium]|nr:radical SAM protein [Bacteroidia bacterium]
MRLIRHPVLANYYLTYRCNAACSFCDIWEKPSPYVTPESVERNLRDLRRLGVRIIDFTGGEPLLHRHLPRFLEMAQRMGFLTTVTTNGLLYPKRAYELRGKVDMLHFSLDAASAQKHDALRGGVPCFAFVQESLKIASRLGEKPDILFTVTPENWNEIEEVYRKFVAPYKLILILNPIFAYNAVGTSLLPAEALHALERWGRRPDVYLNTAFLRLRATGGNQTIRPVCRASTATVVISPEDRLLLPCYHAHEAGYSFPIEGRLYDLYRSQYVRHLQKLEGRWRFCEGCVINCYMEPSFAVEISPYFWSSLPSTLCYAWRKWGLLGSLRLLGRPLKGWGREQAQRLRRWFSFPPKKKGAGFRPAPAEVPLSMS